MEPYQVYYQFKSNPDKDHWIGPMMIVGNDKEHVESLISDMINRDDIIVRVGEKFNGSWDTGWA